LFLGLFLEDVEQLKETVNQVNFMHETITTAKWRIFLPFVDDKQHQILFLIYNENIITSVSL